MTTENCHTIQIANNGFAKVQVCTSCGQVSLNIKFMTVRLEADAFDSLAQIIAEAQRQRALLLMNPQDYCGNAHPSSNSH